MHPYGKNDKGNSVGLISLSEIENKLFNEKYQDEYEFIQDVRDFFKNCEKYDKSERGNFNYAIGLINLFEFELKKKRSYVLPSVSNAGEDEEEKEEVESYKEEVLDEKKVEPKQSSEFTCVLLRNTKSVGLKYHGQTPLCLSGS
jgi:hypothetical protein